MQVSLLSNVCEAQLQIPLVHTSIVKVMFVSFECSQNKAVFHEEPLVEACLA